MSKKVSSEKIIKGIRRRTRTKYSSEEKIRIVLDGIQGEISPAELCCRESISSNLYYRWSKDFLAAGKKRLQGDTVREASTQEVSELKKENEQLKQLVAEIALKNRVLKKKSAWHGFQWSRYMRISASEKLEIIRILEELELSARQTLIELGVPRSTFYKWYSQYLEVGPEGLLVKKPQSRRFWNKIPDEVKEVVVECMSSNECGPKL